MSRVGNRIALGALLMLCAVALFVKLGAPALFDPDEGRNAEKAREILLLHDWITPHENFPVVLDKPIFYYWLVAASYQAFGVSEWSARLPSALAGLGCVALVFFFALRFFGFWEGLWSSLVLVTSLEFYLLARIVIFDMTLTFFTTLSLFSFFYALREEKSRRRTSWLGLMYVSLGAATLVKGPIGVVLPGMVVLVYLLICRKLFLLRELGLHFGIPLFRRASWRLGTMKLNGSIPDTCAIFFGKKILSVILLRTSTELKLGITFFSCSQLDFSLGLFGFQKRSEKRGAGGVTIPFYFCFFGQCCRSYFFPFPAPSCRTTSCPFFRPWHCLLE